MTIGCASPSVAAGAVTRPPGGGARAAAGILLRPSSEADAPVLASILAESISSGAGTFEEVLPDARAMLARRRQSLELGLPHLVACDRSGRVLGYAAAVPFRLRSAYRHSCEDSIHLAPEARGRGIGRLLLATLIDQTTALGLHQMVAVIGDSANRASLALHRALGFRACGVLREVGMKPGRWVDVVLMQRPLDRSPGPPGRA